MGVGGGVGARPTVLGNGARSGIGDMGCSVLGNTCGGGAGEAGGMMPSSVFSDGSFAVPTDDDSSPEY